MRRGCSSWLSFVVVPAALWCRTNLPVEPSRRAAKQYYGFDSRMTYCCRSCKSRCSRSAYTNSSRRTAAHSRHSCQPTKLDHKADCSCCSEQQPHGLRCYSPSAGPAWYRTADCYMHHRHTDSSKCSKKSDRKPGLAQKPDTYSLLAVGTGYPQDRSMRRTGCTETYRSELARRIAGPRATSLDSHRIEVDDARSAVKSSALDNYRHEVSVRRTSDGRENDPSRVHTYGRRTCRGGVSYGDHPAPVNSKCIIGAKSWRPTNFHNSARGNLNRMCR